MRFDFIIVILCHSKLAMIEEIRCKRALKRTEKYIDHEMIMKDTLG